MNSLEQWARRRTPEHPQSDAQIAARLDLLDAIRRGESQSVLDALQRRVENLPRTALDTGLQHA